MKKTPPGSGSGTTDEIVVITPEVPEVIEKPGEVDFEVSVTHIVKKIRKGKFSKSFISFTNHKNTPIKINFDIEGDVAQITEINKVESTIGSNASTELIITFYGNNIGVFSGVLKITGDIEKEIPIDVLVYDPEKLPIEVLLMNIELQDKTLFPGNLLKFKVELQNLLKEERYLVKLLFYIEGIDNNVTIELGEEDVILLTSYSLLNSHDLIDDIIPGKYKLTVQADYIGFSSSVSEIFTVMQPIYKYAIFGFLPLWILFVILAILGIGTFTYIIYKKKQAAKQRYKIELDYDQLPKPGSRSLFIGDVAETTKHTYFDMDKLTIHTIVAGSTGGGKSVAAQVLIEECLMKNTAVLVFDPTAQWSGFLRKNVDKGMTALYARFKMKPSLARGFNGNVHYIKNAREVLDIKKFMIPGEIHIFTLNKLKFEEIDTFVANTVRQVFKADLDESQTLRLLMVYDEVHRLLPKFGGSGEGFTQIERACREFRKWGVGVMLISQVLSDFVGEIKANINTRIQMRTRDEGDLERAREEYGEHISQSVVKAAVGTGMIQMSANNRGRPYFVSFRPLLHSTARLSDEELENYNKYNNIINDLDYQIEQLEKEKLDVYDLKLELKLALDKVKQGNFNMVNIYLEGLTPRIDGHWQKLGKKPKKKSIELVSEEELKKDMEQAKKEKEEAEKKEENKEGEETKEKEEEEHEEVQKAKEEKPLKVEQENEEVSETTVINEKIGKLIQEMNSLIESGDKENAKKKYMEVQIEYKSLDQEKKKSYLPKIHELIKRLTGK